jgi:hypothetical protein
MACTACLVCLIGTVSGCCKKMKKAKNVVLVAGTQQTLNNLYFLLISMGGMQVLLACPQVTSFWPC